MSIMMRDSELDILLLWYHSHKQVSVLTIAEQALEKKLRDLRGQAVTGRDRIFYVNREEHEGP